MAVREAAQPSVELMLTVAHHLPIFDGPTNAHAPTDTVKVASSHSMCVVQTSTQPRSIPALPTMTLSIISCVRYPLAGLMK
jgi:hypothetical protein